MDKDDRPRFHFGDGGYLRALGRLHLRTRMGDGPIYVFRAKGVPILIGADLMQKWGALISYVKDTVKLERLPGKPEIELEVKGKHRLLRIDKETFTTALSS